MTGPDVSAPGGDASEADPDGRSGSGIGAGSGSGPGPGRGGSGSGSGPGLGDSGGIGLGGSGGFDTTGDLDWRAFLVGGGVFMVSGISLVVHILTDAPMAVVLSLLVLGGGLVAGITMASRPEALARWRRLVSVGVVVGVVATVAYDASRWLLVQVAGFHTSPFKALPFFGEALLGSMGSPAARTAAGVGFHLLNGIAFGIAYTVWFGERHPAWGLAFAMGLEAFMLALYPGWLDVRSMQELTSISLLGHVAYGLTLAGMARYLLGRRPLAPVL